MAKTPSRMLPLGTILPTFNLPAPAGPEGRLGAKIASGEVMGTKGLLVIFMCNHCPYVKHIAKPMSDLTKEFLAAGIGCAGINCNDATRYPEDSPAKMVAEGKLQDYRFPYLFDQDQSVARAFDAACTPEFYLFDRNQRLVYRGQFDESRPGNGVPVTGKDLREAGMALIAGRAISDEQKPSIGCNIKWLS